MNDRLPPDVTALATVRSGAALSRWTTFRLGGPCRALIVCATGREVIEAHRVLRATGQPFRILGGGSNLLVSDAGVDAIVLRFSGGRLRPRPEAEALAVEGGLKLDALTAWCAEQGRAGLGFLAGIPGTVAGAVAGNAGAFGQAISDRLRWIDVLEPDGRVVRMQPSDLGFSYRHCSGAPEGRLLLRFGFHTEPGDPDALRAERAEALSFREARHPDWRRIPCAGSFFRNIAPSSAATQRKAAGWFLEHAGAFGMTEGGARVYERHANVIVADGVGATARDVAVLAARMAGAVRKRFGIELQREVRFWGEFGCV